MKKSIKMLAFFAAALIGLQSCDDDKYVAPDTLPNVAESFLTTHFADTEVSSVMKEYDDFTYHYNVYLADGTYVEFNKSGEWREVENRVKGVPSSVVPEKILTYVTTNYSEFFIVDIERDRQYDVELNNDLNLHFSLDGDFLRFDY